MSRAVRWLRVSYWVGAAADALASLEMLFPGTLQSLVGETSPEFSMEYRLAQGYGAPLMIGWTALLLCADRKPLERKGVLVITAFPVVVGLLVRGIIGAADGVFVGANAIVSLAVPILLITLFTYSLVAARGVTRPGPAT